MRLFCPIFRLPHSYINVLFLFNVFFFVSGYAFAQAPTISSFTPGNVCQRQAITITGTNFTRVTAVKVGTQDAAGFTVNSPTTITAVVSNTSQTGKVTVTTPDGSVTTAGDVMIRPSPHPELRDVGTKDAAFSNCDGSLSYTLRVANQSSTPQTNNDYTISWGDGSPAFTQKDWPYNAEVSHHYASQGFFAVTLSITPPNGCTQTRVYQFYNGKNPLASFSTSTSTTGLCVPAPIEFQIGNWTNNTPGTTYEIDFGDQSPHLVLQHPLNTTAVTHLVTHTYTTSSCPAVDFTATLRVSNGCFTTTYTLNQIIIRKKPVADFRTPQTLCINTPVCFTNLTEDGYGGTSCNRNTSFLWEFGDGTTATVKTPPCHTYPRPGTYTVKLSATNNACGDDVKTAQIVILDVSPPPAVAAAPVVYCQGQPATPLTATGTNLLWYNDATGGTGVTTAPTPSTNRPGTYTYYVTQTLPNRCESSRAAITVIVHPLPPVPVVNTPVLLCHNQATGPLTATGTGLRWYNAAAGGTGTPTAPTPATTTTGTVTWYVSQTINGCEGPRTAIEVVVSALAAAPAVSSPLNYCQHQQAIPLTATGDNLRWYTTANGGTGTAIAPTPSTAIAGSTTYYVSQVTGCGESPRSNIVVNVTAGPQASIAYSPAILCNVPNTPATPNAPVPVIRTGASGGAYSITPAGLTIDPVTGTLNPSAALAGTYTIRYTIPASLPCPAYITTTTVTVSSTPAASISYPAICSSDGITSVQLTGSAGGAFSSTAGLNINTTTGAITPASSTPGTYTVTYTVAPSPPCAGFTTSAPVTITPAPTATITYQPATLCNIISAAGTPNPPITPILTGNTGGTYTIAPATGLTINATTGTVNPSGAVPGTYTITYAVAGNGGCALYRTTATLTVSGTPVASISYTGSPYCGSITMPQAVTFSGTKGGTFSAGQGLSVNASTGEIDPSKSTPGSYTVQYAIAPSAPCPGFTTSTPVVINEQPVISFPLSTQAICSGGIAVFRPASTVANTTFNWSVAAPLPAGVSGVSSGTANGATPAISLSFTNTGTASQTLTIRVTPVNPTPAPCPGATYDLTLTVKPITAAPVTDTAHFCMGMPAAPLQVTPLPGNTINWYNNNQQPLLTVPVISTATAATYRYYVSQTNSEGCESPKAAIIAIVHPTLKIISAVASNPSSCGVPSGNIVLHVLDLNDAPVPDMAVTVHYNKFQLPYTFGTRTNASGNITLPLTAGTYSQIYVETAGNCTAQKIPDVFILKDPTPPAQPVAGYNPPICAGATLTLTALSATSEAAGPVAYVWAGPAFGPLADTSSNTVVSFPAVSTAATGTYAVYAMQNNCISLPAAFEVKIIQAPSQPLISTRTPLCAGDDLALQAYSSIPGNTALTWLWKGPGPGLPASRSNVTIDNVQVAHSGIYTVTVTSAETGCSASTDTMIQIGAYPVVTLPQDTITLPTGHLFSLNTVITNAAEPGVLPITQYTWTPAQDLACNNALCSAPVATIKNDICYQVEVTNASGCKARDEVCIRVFCQESQVFIPNAFAPTGEIPENRKLIVRATGINSVKSFRIFNRWGKVLFERSNFPPNSATFGWDGQVNGKPADTGVYIYTVDVICENGVPYTFKGNVTLF
jgi:gliding motility-associated-like protein